MLICYIIIKILEKYNVYVIEKRKLCLISNRFTDFEKGKVLLMSDSFNDLRSEKLLVM